MIGKNVLFDFGNVLIDIDIPRTFREMEQLVVEGLNEEAKSETDRLILLYETGQISSELFINGILKYCLPDVQALDVITAWKSMLVGIPEGRIKWLRSMVNFHRMAILSNTNELHLEGVYSHLEKDHPGLDFENEFFEGVFYSHLIGLRKPDAACFEYALSKLGWSPADTVFIDDVEDNVKAADSIGMTGIHLLPEMPVEELIPPGSLISSASKKQD